MLCRYLVLCLAFGLTLVACQVASHTTVDWAFIGGTSESDQIVQWPSVRGTSSPSKFAGSREGGIFFNDDQNNIWLGLGISWMFLPEISSNTWMPVNDIWSYNLATSRWFWKTGISFAASDAGTYPAQLNQNDPNRSFLTPEAKIKATQWHDRQRNLLFIFGGWSVTALNGGVYLPSRVEGNSMWCYDYKNNVSTLLGPAQDRTSYQGSSTWPAGRYGGAGWLDNNGTMWLYGGIGYGNNNTLEDMWVFNESSTTWVPVAYSGSSHPIVANAATWYDPSAHMMYLFGGEDHLHNYNRDLWTFNPVTLVWTKISGEATSQIASYGTRGEFSTTTHPGIRASAGYVFEPAGYLWLFGGKGMASQEIIGTLNDLWVYSIALNQWAWMGGSQDINQLPDYPDLMTYGVDNTLAGREGLAMYISGRNLYIYGGRISDTHHKADLWNGRIYRDECALNVTDCGPLATCTDLDDGYACVCPPGYTGNGHGVNGCLELDECATGLHNCSIHAQCINTVGGFDCQCNSGYEGTGYGADGCKDIDECALGFNCTEPAFCVNTDGGFRCDCPQNQTPDGANGCTTAPGVVVAPDGTMTTPDGKIITPDGRVVDTVGIAVGVSIGCAAAIAGAVVLVLFLRRKKKRGVTITTAMKSLSNFDDRFNIPYSELEFSRELGAGSFGKVFLGSWRKAEVALKLATLATWEDFANEVKLTINLPPHPNVVQVFGISRDGPHPVLILEYCDGGSLDTLLYDTSYSLSLAQQLDIIHGVAKGMLHLHKSNIIHRDLAARNVLLSGGRPKISDFGLARSVDKQSQSGKTKSDVGPLRWMAPESLRDQTYNPLSDVWSFGVVVFEILCREEPHVREDQMIVGIRIRDEGLTPTIPSSCDPFMRDLMRACWKLDPALRPKFEEICSRIEERIEIEQQGGVSSQPL